MGLNPNSPNDPVTNICQAADKQLFTLVEWAKRVPHFSELPLDDQVILLRAGWNELLIASFSHRSITVKDGILLATGLHVHRNSAHSAGVGAIFDRVLTELVSKMRDMQMDKTELGCLRAIVLFNPGTASPAHGLPASSGPPALAAAAPWGLSPIPPCEGRRALPPSSHRAREHDTWRGLGSCAHPLWFACCVQSVAPLCLESWALEEAASP